MRRHPARDVDADRRDLARRPVSQTPVRPVDPLAGDADGASVADQCLLQVADVALDVAAVPVQVEDRVADELARPMEGRLAAAVGLDDLDVRAGGDVQLGASVGAAAECDDRRMLEKSTVSGIAPCETAPASERCSSQASRRRARCRGA